jgi:mRNA turnover protein 4
VELQEGPLEQFTHDMEPFLRKQGMPVRLNRGKVALPQDSHYKLVPIAFNFFPPRLLRISKLLGPKNFPVSGVGIPLVVLGQLVT